MTDSDADERVLFGLLLEYGNLSTDELARALGGDHRAVRIRDALLALERDGLVHRLDRFAWPTRAMMRATRLAAV
jgi:predicted transcriptional regulator